MKRLSRLFTIILCCTAAVSLTSCLGDDNDGGISTEEYSQWLTNISGFYMGGSTWQKQNKVYFYNDTITDKNNPSKTDSITGITATFFKGDTTVVVQGMPGRVLAKELTGHDDIKQALEYDSRQAMKAKFDFFSISYPQINFYIYPFDVTYSSLRYPNGDTHDVTFKFGAPSLGAYQSLSNLQASVLDFYLIEVFVDGQRIQTVYDGTNDKDKIKKALIRVYVTK